LRPSDGATGSATASGLRCSADIFAKLRATLALAQVPAQVPAQRPAPQLTGGRGRQLLADLDAGDLACPPIFDQGRAGLEDERLHLSGLTAEHLGHLGRPSSDAARDRGASSGEQPDELHGALTGEAA
jgi:hypothetical protein